MLQRDLTPSRSRCLAFRCYQSPQTFSIGVVDQLGSQARRGRPGGPSKEAGLPLGARNLTTRTLHWDSAGSGNSLEVNRGVVRQRREVGSGGRPKSRAEMGIRGSDLDQPWRCIGTGLVLHWSCVVIHWRCPRGLPAQYRCCMCNTGVVPVQCH